MALIRLNGNPVNTNGELPAIGSQAPDFVLVDSNLMDRTLADYRGKRKLLNIVPSLDTAVCAKSTQRFNEVAGDIEDTVMLMISADLPFAQKRFCSEAGIHSVSPLSLMRSRDFATDYGVLITDGALAGITARAVIVLDQNDRVKYTELVTDIADEPDYDKALAAI